MCRFQAHFSACCRRVGVLIDTSHVVQGPIITVKKGPCLYLVYFSRTKRCNIAFLRFPPLSLSLDNHLCFRLIIFQNWRFLFDHCDLILWSRTKSFSSCERWESSPQFNVMKLGRRCFGSALAARAKRQFCGRRFSTLGSNWSTFSRFNFVHLVVCCTFRCLLSIYRIKKLGLWFSLARIGHFVKTAIFGHFLFFIVATSAWSQNDWLAPLINNQRPNISLQVPVSPNWPIS